MPERPESASEVAPGTGTLSAPARPAWKRFVWPDWADHLPVVADVFFAEAGTKEVRK